MLQFLLILLTILQINRPVFVGNAVTGQAEPGATVHLSVIQDPAADAETVANSAGAFRFAGVRLEPGYIVMVSSGGQVDYAIAKLAHRVFVPVVVGR